MTIMSAAWLLTVGGVLGPGVEPSCDTGAGIGDDTVDASVVGAPTTGATLGGKMLEEWSC